MRVRRSDGTLIAVGAGGAGDDVRGAEIAAAGLDHQLAVVVARSSLHQATTCVACEAA